MICDSSTLSTRCLLFCLLLGGRKTTLLLFFGLISSLGGWATLLWSPIITDHHCLHSFPLQMWLSIFYTQHHQYHTSITHEGCRRKRVYFFIQYRKDRAETEKQLYWLLILNHRLTHCCTHHIFCFAYSLMRGNKNVNVVFNNFADHVGSCIHMWKIFSRLLMNLNMLDQEYF